MRGIGSVLAGLLVGGLANAALVQANLWLYPLPADLALDDGPALAAWVSSLPPAAFVLPLLAHLAQGTLGGVVTLRLAPGARAQRLGVVVGLTALGSLYNLLTLPGPVWMWAELLAWPPIYLALLDRSEPGPDATRA